MKRKLIGLLLLSACILFSGCRGGSNQAVQTGTSETETTATDASTSLIPLLEQGTRLEESSNLWYIPNESVESMSYFGMHLLENGLLLSQYADQEMILKHISLENGELIASASVPAGPGAKIYIGNGEIGLCDVQLGQISILNKQFQMLRTYSVKQEGEEWFLNSELNTLYIHFYNRGLLSRNLETGEETWLIDNGFRVVVKSYSNSYLFMEYTDRTNQKTYTRCVNLSTGSMSTLPVDGVVESGFCQGNTWLFKRGSSDGVHVVAEEGSVRSFIWKESDVELLFPKRHLLAKDESQRNLTLYKTDGTFLSQCKLPENSEGFVGENFVWSGYWDGYFFIDFLGSGARLMFWDVEANTEGENLQMEALDSAKEIETVVPPKYYERAKQLSNRFGVEICIGEQCELDYSNYESFALTDLEFIRSALDVLEDSLSQYPEGFFRQLPYGTIESIRIELVGSIEQKEGMNSHPESANGFAQNLGNYYLIVLDGFMLEKRTLFHEFSHIIDKRIEWDSLIREDALYSEEAWLALQPEGFEYAWTYQNYLEIPQEFRRYIEDGYFVNEYSMTFPTEDRAVLMAEAMEDHRWEFQKGFGQKKKFRFYADCIRDCFDTKGWPEETVWEQVFQ